ncbi:MAG: sigma-70 family RNA polymerase sigma factor [Bryobacterales bacterium]|nr:sigma-70 family RNA polymerase sigma factor [Bryobacterales bacterium]
MDAPAETLTVNTTAPTLDLDRLFLDHYAGAARLIGRIVRDPARAEELAVEVFLKLWQEPRERVLAPEGWVYRTAARTALNELRAQSRRTQYERLFPFLQRTPTPEEIASANQEQARVRAVLRAMKPGQAELLLLRSHGLSYEELASSLNLNPASVGTLLSRAQQAFRKEHVKRYGEQSGSESRCVGR